MEIVKKIWTILFFTIVLHSTLYSQYQIDGQVEDYSGNYARVVLEYIPFLQELNRSNMNNIINSARIQPNGKFTIQGDDLPQEKKLYRLTPLKDGVGAGISLGRYNNHIYLILNNSSQIQVSNCDDLGTKHFGECSVSGNPESAQMQHLYDSILLPFHDDYVELSKNNTELKRKMVESKHSKILRTYCDTSQYLIPSMVAYTKLSTSDSDFKSNLDFHESFLYKVVNKNTKSPYVIELKNQIQVRKEILFGSKKTSTDLTTWILLSLVALVTSYAIVLRLKITNLQKTTTNNKPYKELLSTLSQKEYEVYTHIVSGKSNKEIAAALFIEVNTVKSHISKVYHKLGVKSRKEATHFNNQIRSK